MSHTENLHTTGAPLAQLRAWMAEGSHRVCDLAAAAGVTHAAVSPQVRGVRPFTAPVLRGLALLGCSRELLAAQRRSKPGPGLGCPVCGGVLLPEGRKARCLDCGAVLTVK